MGVGDELHRIVTRWMERFHLECPGCNCLLGVALINRMGPDAAVANWRRIHRMMAANARRCNLVSPPAPLVRLWIGQAARKVRKLAQIT